MGVEGDSTTKNSLSLHLRHSTPSAERGSVHSAEVWPDCLSEVNYGKISVAGFDETYLQLRHANLSFRGVGQSRAR